MHDLSETTKRILDLVTAALAGFAALTINDVAVILTVVATAVSIICGGIRIYDRLRYGRGGAAG